MEIPAIENSIYKQFKPYNNYIQTKKQTEKKFNKKAFMGSVFGVAGALALTSKMYNKPLFGWGEKAKPTVLKEVSEILITAGMANIGGVIGGSIGKNKKQVKKKIKEAGFQIMNTSIPMIMVTGATVLCNNVKALNKIPTKIIASFDAMTSGAVIATKLTNIGKPKDQRRKYTPKDSLANFDDIVATIKLGFREVAEKIPVDYILPCIYTYNGYRSGDKE